MDNDGYFKIVLIWDEEIFIKMNFKIKIFGCFVCLINFYGLKY